MAALQTLRNKPALLMSVIGGALLLFIVTLTDLNSCSNPNVEGEVNGKELTYQVYEQQVKDEENVETLLSGTLTEDRKDQIRQEVWDKFEQGQLIEREAGKLGLIATDEDVQNALSGVSQQQLQQKIQMMQYGQLSMANFSYAEKIMLIIANVGVSPTVEGYKQFIKTIDQQIRQFQKQNDSQNAEAATNIKQACLYCESQIPAEVIRQKYMALMALGVTSNTVSAKMLAEEYNTTCNLELAAIPYSTVADADVKVSDEDLKKKYEELKPLFRIHNASRDIKYIRVSVTASAKDQAAIVNQVKNVEASLRTARTAEDVENVMRSSKSDVAYNNVYLPKDYFTRSQQSDVVAALDSMSVGSVTATKIEPKGNDGVQYVSTFKLVGMKTTPDSMQICEFAVDTKAMADSIVAAVKAGSTLSAEAKKHNELVQKYGLKGDTTWVATNYFLDLKADSTSSAHYVDRCQLPAGATNYYQVTNPQTGQSVYVVATVLATKAPTAKYNVAVVKYPIKFSSETYNAKHDALRTFLSKNRTIEAIEKNANKAGYTLIEQPNLTTTAAMNLRYSIGGEGAKEAFIWTFDEAKAGDISRDYECGKNNDQLLVVCVSAINDGDYLAWDNPSVKRQLEMLVKQDKKAEKIMAQMKSVKNIAAARKIKGVEYSEQPQISLAQLAGGEPSLAGAVERTAKGKFTGAVKGAMAVYLAQVNDKKVTTPYNAATAMQQASQNMLMQLFGRDGSTYFNGMYGTMKVVDKRYKF